ncbi:uncharacterized protein L203_102761 [Cryptococcus depauperatus CBS 7841]|uniref:Ribosome biogenesis protein NOP53 n=1 Tax=Cryptococcus depauperatus CBS 7841 TaxID=1295531 RepID=A0A1E3HV01_9TREE|nr:nucleolar protein 53 [Cryptococcus depauperatus CBS 7841]
MASIDSRKKQTKPYDRQVGVKHKGKQRAAQQDLGAPATHSQTSRKGKKAWRKNIDISKIEEAFENALEEERMTGGSFAAKSNDQLYVVDTVGDSTVGAKAKRQHKPLRSLAVLQERSAVPPLTSRITPKPAKTTCTVVSQKEKNRLKRIARKTQAFSDGTGLTSADIKTNGPADKDVWKEEEEEPSELLGNFAKETLSKGKIRAPVTVQRQRENYLSTTSRFLETPSAGVSYNPSAESHSHLINEAYKEEVDRLRLEEERSFMIEKYGSVIEARKQMAGESAEGMIIGEGETDSEEEQDAEGFLTKKLSKRKTTAQRNRIARQRALEAAIRAEKERHKLASSVSSLAAFKRDVEARQRSQMEKERVGKLAKKEKERLGKHEGEKFGKYRIQKKSVEVQLGEDLAESLRQIKPEGNLFKDRFLSLQKRALIEPRQPVLPRKRSLKTKQYEKHAYKRFQ